MTNTYSDLVVMQRGGLTTSTPPSNSGVEVPTNPLIRFYNPNSASTGGEWPANVGSPETTTPITATGIVCYEIIKNKSTGDTVATNGVSHTNGNPVQLNRIFPTAADVTTYAENFANTPGYRIIIDPTSSTLQTPSNNHTSVITNSSYDHFVLLFPDDENKHHFAKITEYVKDDDGNRTSFEFTPSYSKEIPKGTKFTIFKGPQFRDGSGNLVNTDVVALAYGLRMGGSGNKHANHTYLSRPNFYFYEDRVNNSSELDHNTKYTLYSSRSDGSSVSHIKTVFSTVQDFGERIIDNSLYSYNIKLVDNFRDADESATNDYVDWDTCILNIQRKTGDTGSVYAGPTRYLHYTPSPEECSLHVNIMDIEINKNISVSGDYCEIKFTDAQRIMSSKIKENDPLTVRKNLTHNSMSSEYDAQLIGTFTGTSGSTSLTVTLENGQDLTNLLKSGSDYQDIKLGNHYYSISAISSVSSNSQTLTISHYGTSISSRSSGGLQANYSSELAYRPRWSTITQNLIVDFELDSRISDLEIFLTQGTLAGTRLPFATADTNNNFVTLTYTTTRFNSNLIQHILDFYVGGYIIDKKIFEGVVEIIIEESLHGMPTFKIIGRNKVRELLGPIINRNYTHSEDMVYSTYGPIVESGTISNGSSDIYSVGSVAINATTITLNHHDGDSAGTQAIYVGQLIFNSDKHFVGEVASFDDGTNEITLKDGAMTSLSNTEPIHFTSYPLLSFSKAIQSNNNKVNSATSLDASANKGLIFSSGMDLNTDITLIGSSLNTNEDARGYNITSPDNISNDSNFYCALTGLEHSEYYKKYAESKIVNSVMTYDVIDIEQKTNKSTIELAPINPAILARVNINEENTTLETLADSGWTFSAGVTANNFTIQGGTWANIPFTHSTLQSGYIYKSDGTVIGKVLWKRKHTSNTTTFNYQISLDREYTSTASEKIYIISTYSNKQLYFLNKNNIDSGGVVQLVNPQYSRGNRPIGFHDITSETFHGRNLYRYLDLHASDSGLIGNNNIIVNMTNTQPIMGTNSELKTAASSYNFYPGSAFNATFSTYTTPKTSVNIQTPHELTENRPLVGSNFLDANNYKSTNARSDYLPHNFALLDTSSNKQSKVLCLPKSHLDSDVDWARGSLGRESQFSEENQGRLNAIRRAKEYLEHIHKSAEKYFIFSPSDIYPDSKTRESNILNGSKSFADYNIMIYGEPTLEESLIEYQDILGKLNRSNNTDENYETLTISESSHEPSELNRFGVMRLTELCFDWHFNIVDPENIIEKHTTIPNFVYSAHSSIEFASAKVMTVNGAMIYTSGSPDTIKVPILGSGANHFTAGDYAFYPDGNMLGKVSSVVSGDIILNIGAGQDNPNGINSDTDGNFPENNSKLHHRVSTYLSGNETINTIVKGQGKEDTLHNMKGSRSTPKQNEGFQMYKGGVFNSETATFKHDNVNYKSEQDSEQALQIPFYLEQKTTGSYENFNALVFQNDGYSFVEYGSNRKLLGGLLNPGERTPGEYANITPVATDGSGVTDLRVKVTVSSHYRREVTIEITTIGSASNGNTFKITNTDIYDSSTSANEATFTVKRASGTTHDPEDFIHPSRVIEAFQTESQGNNSSSIIGNRQNLLKTNIYYPSRVVLFDKYSLDAAPDGSSNDTQKINVSSINGMCIPVANGGISLKVDAETSGKRYTSIFLPLEDTFAKDINIQSGDYLGVGCEYFFKPILALKAQTDMSGTYPAMNIVTKGTRTHTEIHINNYDSSNITPDGTGNYHPNNYWLDFAPNLTGYYLASMDGYITDLNEASANVYTGYDMNEVSSYSLQPNNIYYVVSHTIIGDANGITHKIVVDGNITDSATPFNRYFRILKPSEVCFHENTPNELEFYTLKSEYTKEPRSDKMYKDVPSSNSFQNSVLGNTTSTEAEVVNAERSVVSGYKEGVLSMYVIVDSDRLGDGNDYVVRSPENFFGTGLSEGNYTFYTTDGEEKYKQNLKIDLFTASKNSSNNNFPDTATYTVPTLTFGSKFKRQVGIVSFSTPFTITSPRPVSLRKASKAKIGCSVSITLEAEDIINDILERNNIQFDNTIPEFEYFIGPNFQGADAYSAINFLARLKNKRLDFNNDVISLTKILDSSNFIKAYITDENSDYKITSVSRENSLFDYYNDITVYGRGVKSRVRDIKGIKKHKTKALEITDESLNTQEEVNTEARRLLQQHTENSKRVTVSLSSDKLKYLRVGDVVDFESKYNGITRGEYLVLGIKYGLGPLELELGVFNSGLQAKLAEILIDNKKSKAFIRGQTFKENEETAINLEQYKVKPIKLIITKTTSAGTFTLGFAQTLNTGTTTLGFTGGTGSSTTTLKEINL